MKRGGRKTATAALRRVGKLEQLESRIALSAVPWGAQDVDTGEFMLGDVSVSVVFFESNGTGANNTEDWTDAYRDEVKAKINDAMQWWKDTLALQSSVHELNFDIDYTYADNPVPIGIEPISYAATELETWVGTFLDYVGAARTDEIDNDVRRYNHEQRVAHDTNWAFTIFVINAQNDSDGLFAPGSIRGAFSIAGGAFMAVPSGRPASTIAHETSHQFWAMDEYANSGDYDDTRGYYDTQNTNAYDGNPDRDSITTSLLGDSAALVEAYANHTSSVSSFESIGWRDSDGDGLFDVFDVPMQFSASSAFDPATNQLRIVGQGSIGVLPNMNSWGRQNSMTTNRISHIEFRVDGGSWQTGPVIDDYTADIDFSVQLADAGPHSVEVRLVDETGMITSAVLDASTTHIDSTPLHGFSGYVTYDANNNGTYDPGEAGLAGWIVEVINQVGSPVVAQTTIEPDDFSQGHIFYDPIDGITLSAFGGGIEPGLSDVAARNSTLASTGERGFYNYSSGSWSNLWSDQRQLRIDFTSPVSRVSIDAIAQLDGDVGVLELYDADDNLLGRYTTSPMAAGSSETMVVELDLPTAAYAIARGHLNDTDDPRRQPLYIGLDNLKVGRSNKTVTNALGGFTLPFDVSGDYRLRITPSEYYDSSDPVDVSLTAQTGTSRVSLSASIAETSWHNPLLRADVNHDGAIDEADIDLILNELRNPVLTAGSATASRVLGASHQNEDPYIDVNADGRFDKRDLLAAIDAKTAQEIAADNLDGEPRVIPLYFPASADSSTMPLAEAEPGSLPSVLADLPHANLQGSASLVSYVIDLTTIRDSIDSKQAQTVSSVSLDSDTEASFASFSPNWSDALILDAAAHRADRSLLRSSPNDEATDQYFAGLCEDLPSSAKQL
ncbi:dockerin type I domain-containing protein [Blastopirellula marina]|uniref:dockerin type I domain-containing protein n=1 Tax=Blastopirellula marina TaxID=124 RepID=UPI001304B586|nr:dockerin type I domain-containing protein [Blastopirellula marina]